MKKIIYIILDGIADQPIKELDNKTPLEAAVTPQMDLLAQKGVTGMVYPMGKNIVPQSDTAVISILGYDHQRYYTGRGPLEAFAEGVPMSAGNLALRATFACVEPDGQTLKDRRAGRNLTVNEAAALAQEINVKVSLSNATFEFKHTVGHWGVLVVRGMHAKLSGWITNTDPAYERVGSFSRPREKALSVIPQAVPMAGHEDSLEAQEAANLLNEFTQKSQKVLNESVINKKRISENKMPANIILSRDAGDALPQFPDINSKYNMKFGCFVQMPVERGIALLTGMEIIAMPSSTGHLDVDYQIWAKIARDALQRYDGIYIHIKGPDEAGHDGDHARKKEVIELIDKFFFANLIPHLNLKDFIVAVTADHATVCACRAHSDDPVPILIAGGKLKPDGSMSFSEKAAHLGSLGEIKGTDIISLLVKFAQN
ncbi:MAG: alkaline phosphatase family protein [Candidatus Omnitrophota bacterium]|jgi:2,3-bisphosphoglycerate-independent phosphoglycerate mutase